MQPKRKNFSFRGKSITILCTDQSRSDQFYRELLGAVRVDEGYGCPWYQLGDFTFSLLPNATEPCPVQIPNHAGTMLWLEVEDIHAAHSYLVQNEVPVKEWDETQSMIITDPDGVLIEVWQAQPASNDKS